MSEIDVNVIKGYSDAKVVQIPTGVSGEYVQELFDGSYGITVIKPSDIITKGPWVDARAYGALGTQAAIAAALADIDTDERTLYLAPDTWSITSSVGILANVNVKMERGAVLAIATGVTVTINGTLEAGLYQIFSCTGTGKVVLTGAGIPYALPHWWYDGAGDWGPAYKAAMIAAQHTYFPAGTYNVRSDNTLGNGPQCPSDRVISGDGPSSIIKLDASSSSYYGILLRALNQSNITIKDICFDSSGDSILLEAGIFRYPTVDFNGCHDIRLDNVTFKNGIHWVASWTTCYDVYVNNPVVINDLSIVQTSTGNVDGLHFDDCHDCHVTNAVIESRDDCIAFTSSLANSYNCSVNGLNGVSLYANGVKIETLTSTLTLTNMNVYNVQFSNYAGATYPDMACALWAKSGNTTTPHLTSCTFDNIYGTNCLNVVLIHQATKITASNLSGDNIHNSGVYLRYTTDSVINGGVLDSPGVNDNTAAGVFIENCTNVAVSNLTVLSAKLWGVFDYAGVNTKLTGLTLESCGSYVTGDPNRGGIGLSASVGYFISGCTVKDATGTNTRYGIFATGVGHTNTYIGADNVFDGLSATNITWLRTIPRSYSGATPVGAVVPDFVGQELLLDNAGTLSWWRSKGLTNTDWLKMSN